MTTNQPEEPFGEPPTPKGEGQGDNGGTNRMAGARDRITSGIFTTMTNLQNDLAISSIMVKAMAAARSGSTKTLDAELLHLLQTDEATAARVLTIVELLERRYAVMVTRLATLKRMEADEGEPMDPAGEEPISKHGDESWMGRY